MVGMASSMALPSGGLKSKRANRSSMDLSGINDKLVSMLKAGDGGDLFE